MSITGLSVVICDTDKNYIEQFVRYFTNKCKCNILISGFICVDKLYDYLRDNSVDLIIMSEEIYKIYNGDEKILVLTENHSPFVPDKIYMVCKYQNMDIIMSTILEYLSICNNGITSKLNVSNKVTKIIGVYTPINVINQDIITFGIGQEIGKYNKVFTLFLSEFSGLSRIINNSSIGNMSDFLYFFMQRTGNIEMKFNSLLNNNLNVDYINPIYNLYDYKKIDINVWSDLINFILALSTYDVLLINLSTVIPDIFSLLKLCDTLIIPTVSDTISNIKIEEFIDNFGMIDINFNSKYTFINIDEYLDNYRCGDFFENVNVFSNTYSNIIKNLF